MPSQTVSQDRKWRSKISPGGFASSPATSTLREASSTLKNESRWTPGRAFTREHVLNPQTEVDVLIIGSGPAGATFARTLADARPSAKILMLEAGPQLTHRPGMNVKNISELGERAEAQRRSQGPSQFSYERHADRGLPAPAERLDALARFARPGTFLIEPEPELPSEFPGGGASSNVGGMGAHWTCACPSPSGTERISFISEAEMDRLLARAEYLLQVRTDNFAPTVQNGRITTALAGLFEPPGAAVRPVGQMPLACTRLPSGELHWAGSDTILGGWTDRLADPGSNLRLRSDTLCRRLLFTGDRITGAELEHLPTGCGEEVLAKFVVVAADSLHSPQLLWASGIRPPALGHYLNEHPQILSAVRYRPSAAAGEAPAATLDASELGVFWVPFREPGHTFHGQIMSLPASPIPMADGCTALPASETVALCWFCRKEIQFEDRVEFSASATDFHGLPAMTIHYRYSAKDRETFKYAIEEETRAAACFGEFVEGREPALLPAGRSLHYQGTMRMGAEDDGASVCDSFARVWGFENLFLGGNGVIPTSTACNPTLTTVALAVRAAEQMAARLDRRSP